MIMEYQKIINLLDNTPSKPTKFRTKNWVEINDDAHGTYNNNSQIKSKTSMLRSSLWDYSDAYTLVKGTISIEPLLASAQPEIVSKEVAFKNFAPFTDCISEKNNTQIDNAKYIHVIMSMYTLIE